MFLFGDIYVVVVKRTVSYVTDLEQLKQQILLCQQLQGVKSELVLPKEKPTSMPQYDQQGSLGRLLLRGT